MFEEDYLKSIENQFLNQDSLSFMKEVPDKYFDLILTDPPYDIDSINLEKQGYAGNNYFKKKNWDNDIPQEEFFNQIFRISKNQIICGANYFGLKGRGYIVWDKGEGFYNRSFSEAELLYTSFDMNIKIFKYDPLAKGDYHNKIHPTQKPIPLFNWLLERYSKPNDLILDPFSGSGTTAIAAYNTDRRFICIEKDEEYYNKSIERYNNHIKLKGGLFK